MKLASLLASLLLVQAKEGLYRASRKKELPLISRGLVV